MERGWLSTQPTLTPTTAVSVIHTPGNIETIEWNSSHTPTSRNGSC